MNAFTGFEKHQDLYKPDRGAIFASTKRRPTLRSQARRWWRISRRALYELAWQISVAAVQRRVIG